MRGTPEVVEVNFDRGRLVRYAMIAGLVTVVIGFLIWATVTSDVIDQSPILQYWPLLVPCLLVVGLVFLVFAKGAISPLALRLSRESVLMAWLPGVICEIEMDNVAGFVPFVGPQPMLGLVVGDPEDGGAFQRFMMRNTERNSGSFHVGFSGGLLKDPDSAIHAIQEWAVENDIVGPLDYLSQASSDSE